MSSEHTMDGTTMLACVVHGKHDLRVEEVPRPRPGPGEVAIAVELGGICGSDLHYYHRGAVGDFAVREPMILGHEMTGRVARSARESPARRSALR
jgi:L-idonate 5-dehydrogenase